MKPFQKSRRVAKSQLTTSKPKPGVNLIVAIFLVSISSVHWVHAGFWYEDFTDEDLNDAGIDWVFERDHLVSPNGLQLSSPERGRASAVADWPSEREGWSIRTQGRLQQDHGIFGAATSGLLWSAIFADGVAALGNFQTGEASDYIETELRPFDEDVIVQLDTLDGVMRMWAWPAKDGEQPEEDIAPLIEESLALPLGAPGIWAWSDEGPSSALFSWVAISTEHMPVTMDVPLSDRIGDFSEDDVLDVADINRLATAIQMGKSDPRFDLNHSGTVDLEDHSYWVDDLKHTWIGDANLDGEFNSGDFVEVFQAGKYETGEAAGWNQGDWNVDAVFDSSDFVSAFQGGGYEMGARPAVAAVPEPSAAILLALGLLGTARLRNAESAQRLVWRIILIPAPTNRDL